MIIRCVWQDFGYLDFFILGAIDDSKYMEQGVAPEAFLERMEVLREMLTIVNKEQQ